MLRPPPSSPLFPYTTLFRSQREEEGGGMLRPSINPHPAPACFAHAGSDIPARFAFTFSVAPSIAVFASIPATRVSLTAFLLPFCSVVLVSVRRRVRRFKTSADVGIR